MKYIWCRERPAWVPRDEFFAGQPVQAGPNIITDETDAFKSMGDGKVYSSKSSYRRSLKEQGLVEYGNDRDTQSRPEPPSAAAELARYFD